MKNDKLPELPQEFYPESNNPTEILHNLFQEVTKYRLKCKECGNKIYASQIQEECIDPWIEYTLFKDIEHPLYQLKTWQDLFTVTCPECGEPAYMKGCAI